MMKKILSILLVISLILTCTYISVYAITDTTVTLSEWSGLSDYCTVENGTVTVANNNNRNNFFLSPADTLVKNFILEADVTTSAKITDVAPPAVGLAFGVTDPDIINKTATGWPNDFFALHILFNKNYDSQKPTLYLFKAGATPFDSVTIETYKTTNRLRLVMEDNVASVYINGEFVYKATVTGYNGGQVGFCTYNTSATFSNINYINMDAVKPSEDMNWTVNPTIAEKAGYSINANGDVTLNYVDNWNNFLVTKDMVVTDNFILSADITASLNDLTGAGFILSTNETAIQNNIWASDHLAIKIEHIRGEVRIHNLGIDEYYAIDDFDPAAKNNLKVEVNGANVKVYVNGTLITDFDCNELVKRAYKSIGFNAYDTETVYSNVKYIPVVNQTVDENWYGLSGKHTVSDVTQDKIVLTQKTGNNFLVFSNKLRSFTMEAVVTHSQRSAGFLFGAQTNDCTKLGRNWYGVHLNADSVRLFNESNYDVEGGLDIKKSISGMGESKKLRLVVEGNRIRVYVNNLLQIDVIDTQYIGGYVGVCNYATTTTFTKLNVASVESTFATNLENFESKGGNWKLVYGGYNCESLETSSAFLTSDYFVGANERFNVFVNVTPGENNGVFGITFNLKDKSAPEQDYCYAYIDTNNSVAGIAKVKDGNEEKTEATLASAENYTLKLEYTNSTADLYIDNVKIVSLKTELDGGYVGILTTASSTIFNRLYAYSLEPVKLSSLQLVGAEMDMSFDPYVLIYTATVENNVESVTVNAKGVANYTVNIAGVTANTKTVNLVPGYNRIVINVTNPETGQKTVYNIIVRRLLDSTTLYNEPGRAQLHFSAQIKYANDPNGLVYNAYRDEYHLYFQYSPYNMGHGMKSWGHAVSKDLVNWEELPIAIYDDKNGSKWSGSAVIDKNNTSGFFDESTHPDDRMVAIITDWVDGIGASVSIAYSTDGGRTYNYYNDGEPVIRAQDPKVLWHEETKKWLLIPTSGVIYYSSDLKNWESGGRMYQKNGTTFPWWECQDLYPLKVEGQDEVKWVYNAAGSWYVVGRLEFTENSYNFYAETLPQLYNGESNQEKDKTLSNGYFFEQPGDQTLYATQSFFNDKYGRRLSISWVCEKSTTNSWQGYQTLTYEQKLYKTDDGYTMYSYPVEEVNKQRQEKLFGITNTKVEAGTNILENVNSLIYDIDAVITLNNGCQKVGFTLRDDGINYIKVYYDAVKEQLVVDKSQSGSIYTKTASLPMSKLDGNKIKLRIIVDNGVLEIFGNDGEAPFVSMANPKASTGMSFFTEGGSVTVDSLAVYNMRSIWQQPDIVKGDCNLDGEINTTDLAVLKLFLAGIDELSEEETFACDLDGDGNVNTVDLATLKINLAGIE